MKNTNAAKETTLSTTFRLLLGGVLMVLAATACTKKKELRNDVDSNAYISKTDLVGKTFHLTRGIEEADETNEYYMVPGFSEDFGLVEARITEDELQFISVFNPNGKKETAPIVASYPIVSQFDIQRDKNDFGDQTNRIVEDRKKPWNERAYIRVDWSRPINSMARFLNRGGSEENTVLLESATADKSGHITWKVETAVSNGYAPSARVMYRTHLLPAKDSDFVPVSYSMKDFERFGYFFTEQIWDDKQLGKLDKNVTRYARVFNICEAGVGASCSTSKVTWVLSKGFPEMYKDVTRKAVGEWNEAFQAALGRTDTVIELDETREADISDPRQNVIAYYPERTSIGLLGVAQSVNDPKTGRVIAARSTIFEDGIQGTLGQVDQIIEILNSNDAIADIVKTDALRGTKSKITSPFTGANIAEHVAMMRSVLGVDSIKGPGGLSRNPRAAIEAAKPAFIGSADKSLIRMSNLAKDKAEVLAMVDLSKVNAALKLEQSTKDRKSNFVLRATNETAPYLNGMEDLVFGNELMKEERLESIKMAQHGVHGAELVEDAAIRYLMKLAQTQTPAQMKSAKEQIKEQIAKQTFYTTLLHEMGHNFGLRHNFEGSADEENYMPQYKALNAKLADPKNKDVNEDDLAPFEFSSVMDYGSTFYSQVGGLGDYDKAAIKYAYNRGVNRDEVALKKVDGKLTDSVKFKFCTDHQAGESITCRRWDRGSNASEITDAEIERYDRNWPLSHFRRDRVEFASPRGMMRRNLRAMIPIRQVMDELLYTLIVDEKIDAETAKNAPKGTTEGFCSSRFVHASIVRGEMANICDAVSMERAQVDPTDLETFYKALFKPDGKRYKAVSEYVPNGLADLLSANVSAQIFFQNVLGSTEPGTYLALPQQKGQPFRLIKLDENEPDDKAKLTALAKANGIANVDQFIAQYEKLITEVRIGGYGRPLGSAVSTTAGVTQLESMGAVYDKQAAILALGYRDIGVWKYLEKSMTANAYAAPQTKRWATSLFTKVITGNSAISLIPATLRLTDPKTGQAYVVPAIANASLSVDTQNIATFVAFSLLVADTETSFINKLRICDSNESQCAGDEVVEAKAPLGGTYRAVQTESNDSISFALVTDLKKLADQRDKWKEIGKKAGEAQAVNLVELDGAGEIRERIDANLAKIKELEEVRAVVTGPNPESAWSQLVKMTQEIAKRPPFDTMERANEIGTLFAVAGSLVDIQIGELGTNGICVGAPAPGNGNGNVSPVTGVDDELRAHMAARARGNPGNMNLVLANMAPPPAPPVPGNAPAAPSAEDCMKTPAAQRRATLVQLKTDLATVSKLVNAVLEANVNQVAAPLQMKTLTTQMESKEGFINVIRYLKGQSIH
ncbi:MAG: zinc-dependent metalloprotease [Bdellovibrionota bacterium]